MSTRLNKSGNAVFNSSGVASVVLGPATYSEKWEIKKLVVSSTSTALKPQVLVYRGGVMAANMVDGSRSGDQDVSDTSIVLFAPESLTFQWTGGTPGTSVTATVEGDVVYGSRR